MKPERPVLSAVELFGGATISPPTETLRPKIGHTFRQANGGATGMMARVLVLQEKSDNIANIQASLPDCQLLHVRTVDEASELIFNGVDMIISAVHLEHDGSVFDLLKLAKADERTKDIPFVFYCSQNSAFARSVRDGLQIAARALGADKYITMEDYDPRELRHEFIECLPVKKEK
jgi:CheY-like chemotaxis protein